MLIKTAPYAPGDSYVALDTADAFHTLRANFAWTSVDNDDQRTAALVLASDYIDANYRLIPSADVHPTIATAVMTLAPAFVAGSTIAASDNRAVIEETLIGPVGLQKTTKWSPITGTPDAYPLITAILAPAILSASPFTVVRLIK